MAIPRARPAILRSPRNPPSRNIHVIRSSFYFVKEFSSEAKIRRYRQLWLSQLEQYNVSRLVYVATSPSLRIFNDVCFVTTGRSRSRRIEKVVDEEPAIEMDWITMRRKQQPKDEGPVVKLDQPEAPIAELKNQSNDASATPAPSPPKKDPGDPKKGPKKGASDIPVKAETSELPKADSADPSKSASPGSSKTEASPQKDAPESSLKKDIPAKRASVKRVQSAPPAKEDTTEKAAQLYANVVSESKNTGPDSPQNSTGTSTVKTNTAVSNDIPSQLRPNVSTSIYEIKSKSPEPEAKPAKEGLLPKNKNQRSVYFTAVPSSPNLSKPRKATKTGLFVPSYSAVPQWQTAKDDDKGRPSPKSSADTNIRSLLPDDVRAAVPEHVAPENAEKNAWVNSFGAPEPPHPAGERYQKVQVSSATVELPPSTPPEMVAPHTQALFNNFPPNAPASWAPKSTNDEHTWDGFDTTPDTNEKVVYNVVLRIPSNHEYKPYFGIVSWPSEKQAPYEEMLAGEALNTLDHAGMYLAYLRQARSLGVPLVHVSKEGVTWKVRDKAEAKKLIAHLLKVEHKIGESEKRAKIDETKSVKKGPGLARRMFWAGVWVGGLTGAIGALGQF